FGRNAILRGDSETISRVPPAQRSVFEGLQDKLKILQQTVRYQESQRVMIERRRRSINPEQGLSR
ncbi:hypothetical protein, partial [Brucella intermedia]|uniref:hypothetical protein n=1 Tax=Brucella intermedia TaxID=94625 RepID=UPI0034CF1D15